jgi:hypothetical protein
MLAKTAVAWEKLGSALALPFAGVHIVKATKLLYRPIMVGATQRSRAQLTPILVPAGSPRLDESPL